MSTYSRLKLFSSAPVLASIKLSIVIPVKNEERYILDLLESLINQIDAAGNKISYNLYEILILANNCTDCTVELITEFKRANPGINLFLESVTLDRAKANIGYVRKALMDLAYLRLYSNGGGIMLTTDGDTIVAKDWIYQNRAEIEKGADAVGGRILLKEDELADLDEVTMSCHKKDEEYQLLTAELQGIVLENFDYGKGCHHQHFNGSFAVTTDCYQKSGGVPNVRYLEDCAFFEKLQRIDARVRHSNKVQVKTSARFFGRTEIGLSQQLNCWKNTAPKNTNFPVESCESIVNRLIIKKKLSDLWNNRDQEYASIITNLKKADEKMVITTDLIIKFFTTKYYGEWFDEVNQLNARNWREKFAVGSIDEEILKLKEFIKNYSD